MINAQVRKGDNVLITGIGGGVALIALQLCLAIGANVFVSSGNEEKIKKAVALGAKGGVNYKQKDWPKQLEALVKKHSGKQGSLSAVIDSGGGDIMGQTGKILKAGGRVVVYGMCVWQNYWSATSSHKKQDCQPKGHLHYERGSEESASSR